jgi:DNA-binding transcriptional LysR family regulator
VVKQGRHLALTRNGEILMGYARRLLALNDEAQRALKGELLQGEIRIGMQEDFGESLMPGILGEFRRHHPGLRIIARVDRNQALLSALDDNALDMALLWQPENSPREGKLLGQCQLEWIQHPERISARCWHRASRCRW